MDSKKYHALLILIVPHVLELISNNENYGALHTTGKKYSIADIDAFLIDNSIITS